MIDKFDVLARDIGEYNIIAKGLDSREWTHDIAFKYFKDVKHIYDYLPSILITDSHPEMFKEASLRI